GRWLVRLGKMTVNGGPRLGAPHPQGARIGRPRVPRERGGPARVCNSTARRPPHRRARDPKSWRDRPNGAPTVTFARRLSISKSARKLALAPSLTGRDRTCLVSHKR